MQVNDHVAAGVVGAATAASIPDEMMHFVLKVAVGALTGLLTAAISALIRRMWGKK